MHLSWLVSEHDKWAGLEMISPNADTGSFSSWWSRFLKEVDKLLEKGINSLILLVAFNFGNNVTMLFSILLPQMSTKWNRESKKALFGVMAGAKELQGLPLGIG